MKKIERILRKVIITAAVLSVIPLSSGCSQSSNVNTKNENTVKLPSGFIQVPVPQNGITGSSPSYRLAGTEPWWQGVFVNGRTVKLSPYAAAEHEVTYKLWKEVYDWAVKPENGYKFEKEGTKGSTGEGSEYQPVTNICWRDCIIWCNAYTQMQNKGSSEKCVYVKSKENPLVLKNSAEISENEEDYVCDLVFADMSKPGFRLPTEAEWEWAARWQGKEPSNAEKYGEYYLTKLNGISGSKKSIGFEGLPLPQGETWETLQTETARFAVYGKWFNGTAWIDQTPPVTGTAAVGQKAPNALGLYDMSGNVWERCFDWYDEDPKINDKAGINVDPQGALTGDWRVRRGGAYNSRSEACSLGVRYFGNKESEDVGLRLVFSLTE